LSSKDEPLVLGIEDGSFPARQQSNFKALLVADFFRGFRLQDIRLNTITVDGIDATDALLNIIHARKSKPEIAILAGISYGGFNFIDPFRLHEDEELASIIVTTERPNNVQVKAALQKHFPDCRDRWRVYRRLNNFRAFKANPKENPIFVETVGLSYTEASRILRQSTVIGRVPEPLRVARMIARGLSDERLLEILNL
jgi:endonuclease V-like protein UPF0215 family